MLIVDAVIDRARSDAANAAAWPDVLERGRAAQHRRPVEHLADLVGALAVAQRLGDPAGAQRHAPHAEPPSSADELPAHRLQRLEPRLQAAQVVVLHRRTGPTEDQDDAAAGLLHPASGRGRRVERRPDAGHHGAQVVLDVHLEHRCALHVAVLDDVHRDVQAAGPVHDRRGVRLHGVPVERVDDGDLGPAAARRGSPPPPPPGSTRSGRSGRPERPHGRRRARPRTRSSPAAP